MLHVHAGAVLLRYSSGHSPDEHITYSCFALEARKYYDESVTIHIGLQAESG